MSDREFFEKTLNQRVEEKALHSKGSVTVRLRLTNDETIKIARVLSVGEGWAVFDISAQREVDSAP